MQNSGNNYGDDRSENAQKISHEEIGVRDLTALLVVKSCAKLHGTESD